MHTLSHTSTHTLSFSLCVFFVLCPSVYLPFYLSLSCSVVLSDVPENRSTEERGLRYINIFSPTWLTAGSIVSAFEALYRAGGQLSCSGRHRCAGDEEGVGVGTVAVVRIFQHSIYDVVGHASDKFEGFMGVYRLMSLKAEEPGSISI